MPDFLSVSLQDILYRGQSELRTGEINLSSVCDNKLGNDGCISSDANRCLLYVYTIGIRENVCDTPI